VELIRKKKLSEQVLDQLITAISTGEFPVGSQMPSERDLMNRIGVGRPSIREALQALQQMGLVTIAHGERARVNRPTPEHIIDQISAAMITMLATNVRGLEDLKEARVLLEGALVRIAADRARLKDIKRLGDVIETMRAAVGDSEEFVKADMHFHELIGQMSGNALIAAVVKGMLEWLSRFKRDLVSAAGAEALTIAEHERILAAIAKGDAEAASAAMIGHITRANERYSALGGVPR
jgi:DNA-binding FadR family transcriptional regulator